MQLFKKKGVDKPAKEVKIFTNFPEWAKNSKSEEKDRVYTFLSHQQNVPPRVFFNTVRRYWFLAIAMNIISLIYLSMSFVTPYNKNMANPVTLVRVDGKLIEETIDQRREVLMENVLKRVEIKSASSPTNVKE